MQVEIVALQNAGRSAIGKQQVYIMKVKKAKTTKAAAKSGKTLKGPKKTAAVNAVIAKGKANAKAKGTKAVAASKKKQAAPKKDKDETSTGSALPACAYKHQGLSDAHIRHCRNKGGVEDLQITTGKDNIKAGDIIKGAHGYRVAKADVEGVRSAYGKTKFVANCVIEKDGKEYKAMHLTEDALARSPKAGTFAVYKDGKDHKNCLIRSESWQKNAGVTGEVVKFVKDA